MEQKEPATKLLELRPISGLLRCLYLRSVPRCRLRRTALSIRAEVMIFLTECPPLHGVPDGAGQLTEITIQDRRIGTLPADSGGGKA